MLSLSGQLLFCPSWTTMHLLHACIQQMKLSLRFCNIAENEDQVLPNLIQLKSVKLS
jgi:hypothetical protein